MVCTAMYLRQEQLFQLYTSVICLCEIGKRLQILKWSQSQIRYVTLHKEAAQIVVDIGVGCLLQFLFWAISLYSCCPRFTCKCILFPGVCSSDICKRSDVNRSHRNKSLRFTLVSSEMHDVQEAKKALHKLTSLHVYSVQPTRPKVS